MAANMINVGVNVSDNGTVAQLQARLKSLTKELSSLKNVMRQTSGGMAGMGGSTKQENIEYRNARGVAGTGGGGSRDFAKQAQGLGGLVRLYATFAANIFAVSAAFMALDKAAQFTQMIQGAKALEASTGASLRTIADQMKSVTDGALSMQESMRLTALGSAAGLSQKKILELTKGAKGASLALGRDMGDSIDRVIRGVAKLEPELLDELGVVTRAQEAYKNYAKTLNITTDELTSYQKTLAYSSAVSDELLTKFGAIADSVPANPYAKFLGQLKDVGTELLNLVNTVITPVVSLLANNIELIFVGVLLLVKKLTLTALPEITKLFTVSAAVVTARQAQNQAMLASIKEANDAEIKLARTKNAELIAIEQNRATELLGINSGKLINTSKGIFSAKSAITKNLESGEALEPQQIGVVKRALNKTSGALTAAMDPASTASFKEIQVLAEKEAALNSILKITAENSKIEANSATVVKKLKAEQKLVENEITAQKALQKGFSEAEIDLAKDNLAVLKLQKANAVETAKYYGSAAEAKRIGLAYDIQIEEARRKSTIAQGLTETRFNLDPSGKQNPNFGEAGEAPTLLGKITKGADSLTDKFKNVASKVGSGISKVVGFLGTWGVAATVAFEVATFFADKLGLLNKENENLSKSFEEGGKVLETATSALYSYNIAATLGVASSTSLVKANTIISNTFDQVNDSISVSLDSFVKWEAASTGWSRFWEKVLPGKSKFEELKILVSSELSAAAALATGFEKTQLEAMSKRASSTTEEEGVANLNKIQQQSSVILQRTSEAKKIESSRIQDLTQKYGDAANAVENFNKKQIIKNADLRVIDETLVALDKFTKSTATESAKLQMLAALPEEIAKLDKVLADSRKSAIEELASRKAAAEAQAKILKEQKDQEDKYKISRTQLNLLDATSTEELIRLRSTNSVAQNRAEDKYFNERMEKEKKAKKQLQETETAQKLRDDEVRNKTLKSLGYDVGKEIATGFLAFIPDFLLGEKFKSKPKEVPAEAKLAVDNAIQKSKNQLPSDMIAPNFGSPNKPIKGFGRSGTQTNEILKNTKLTAEEEAAAIERARKANAAKERDNALAKLALQDQLKLLKAQGDQISLNNRIEEKRVGYLSEASISAEFANKRAEEEQQYKLNLLDIDSKILANNKKKGLDAEKTANNLSVAEQATKQAYQTKLQTLALEEREKKSAADLAEYNLKSVTSMKESLVVGQDALALKVATGQINEQDALTQENILSLVNNTIDRETILTQAKSDSYTNEAEFLGTIYEIKLRTNMDEAKHIEEMNKLKQIAFARAQAQLELDNKKAALDIKVGEATKTSGSATMAQMQEKFLLRQLQLQQDITVAGGKTKDIEQAKLKAQADFIALLEEELTVRKRNFATLNGKDQAQTIYDEAAKRAREFGANMKDTVTGIFDAVYSGMDAAIDDITTKMMNGTKITFKEITDLFRNTVAEGFREMAANQLKLSARNLIKDILGKIPGVDLSTNEEKALSYAERTAIATETLVNIGPGGGGAGGTGDRASSPGILDRLKSAFGFGQTGAGGFEDYKNAPDTSKMELDEATAANEAYYGSLGMIEEQTATLGEEVPTLFSKISGGFGELFGGDGIVMTLLGGLGKGIGGIFESIFGMFSGGGGVGGFGGILSSLGGLFSGGDIGSAIGSSLGMEGFGGWLSGLFFANGGVMSEYGAMKLNKYASGGIANSPQMAIYGEGRQPEAYVPLPDGRTIPVTMQGNMGGGSGPISIVVNVDAKGNTDAQATGTSNAQDAKQLGMLISSKVREEIVAQQRSGGLLNKR